ncbi:hypothetical protein E4U52_005817 [Claviceps spartinae]|nr:hypothetical protein E4U52_005817 [Claviceps spartinae]
MASNPKDALAIDAKWAHGPLQRSRIRDLLCGVALIAELPAPSNLKLAPNRQLITGRPQ